MVTLYITVVDPLTKIKKIDDRKETV